MLVKIIHSYSVILLIALSKVVNSSSGFAIFIAGASIQFAPKSSKAVVNLDACSRALVTKIFLPNNGLLSNH